MRPPHAPPADPSLVAAFADLPFPLSKQAAAEWVEGTTVTLEPGLVMSLADLLRGVPAAQIASAEQASLLVESRWQAIARSLAAVARAEGERARRPQ